MLAHCGLTKEQTDIIGVVVWILYCRSEPIADDGQRDQTSYRICGCHLCIVPSTDYTKVEQNRLPSPLSLRAFPFLSLYCSEKPACSSFRPHMQLRDTAAVKQAAMVYFCEITKEKGAVARLR